MGWKHLSIAALLAAVVLVFVVYYRAQVNVEFVDIENWIGKLGVWGTVVFLCLFVVLTSVFFPDSVLSAAAGALFGLKTAIAIVFLGTFIAQSIAFGLSRVLLQERVQRLIARWPKLAAVARAADQQGLRLQVLLRIAPLNQLLVSYVVATTRVSPGNFLIGLVAMLPTLVVQVYCGYTAAHVAKAVGGEGGHSMAYTASIVAGLVVCIALLAYLMRMATRAIAEAELQTEPA